MPKVAELLANWLAKPVVALLDEPNFHRKLLQIIYGAIKSSSTTTTTT